MTELIAYKIFLGQMQIKVLLKVHEAVQKPHLAPVSFDLAETWCELTRIRTLDVSDRFHLKWTVG